MVGLFGAAASVGAGCPVAAGAGASAATAPAADPRAEIVFLGDSLTAGLGLDTTARAFRHSSQQRLDERGADFEVVNAGVSGDTSAGGLRRLDWSLEGDVRVLVVALGGNDGLRGLPPAELKKNLAAIIEPARRRAGVDGDPGRHGSAAELRAASTRAQFRSVYRDLAQTYDVPFIPFLLQGVAGDRVAQPGGRHPSQRPRARAVVADTVWRGARAASLEALAVRPAR